MVKASYWGNDSDELSSINEPLMMRCIINRQEQKGRIRNRSLSPTGNLESRWKHYTEINRKRLRCEKQACGQLKGRYTRADSESLSLDWMRNTKFEPSVKAEPHPREKNANVSNLRETYFDPEQSKLRTLWIMMNSRHLNKIFAFLGEINHLEIFSQSKNGNCCPLIELNFLL